MSRLAFTAIVLLYSSGVAAPAMGADAAAECRTSVPRLLARCVGKAASAELACHWRTGARCSQPHAATENALGALESSLRRRCRTPGAIASAGYAPLDQAGLATHLRSTCAREVEALRVRAYASDTGARAERRCRRAVGREGRRLLSGMIRRSAACTKTTCQLDRVSDAHARLAAAATARLDRACTDLSTMIGMDTAHFVAETAARLATVAASPCDPLDGAICLFPFPNDYFSRPDPTSPSGRRLAFEPTTMPANNAGATVDPSRWNELDGFSTGPLGLVHLPGADFVTSGAAPLADVARSLDADTPFVLIDAETGDKQLHWVERDQIPTNPTERATMIRVGKNLKSAHRYLVAVRGLRDAGGSLLPTNPTFAAYRDRVPTNQLPAEARRPLMEELFAELAAAGIPRPDLQLAWEFTTQSEESVSRQLLHMRDDALDNVLGTDAPTFRVDTITEPLTADILRRIDGTFQVPLYLTEGGAPGALLRRNADGLPVNEGDFFTAQFRCLVPYAATSAGSAPAVPGRGLLYGHGLLGSERETGSSHVRDFSSEHNFIVCGTRWSGFAEDDLTTVFSVLSDFSNFPKFIDRQHQGVLNFMVLGRLLRHSSGFASHPAFQVGGESVIDPSATFYDGNSQGGILGGVLAATERDIERFVLGVPGMTYSTLLSRSVDFAPFFAVLQSTYPEGLDRSLLLSIAQTMWDQTDPNGHVGHVTTAPYPGTPPKKLLYQVAFGDHQVANVTVEVAARTNGAHIHQPALDPAKAVPDVQPFFDIPAIPAYPFDGSAVVIWDSGNPAPPVENIPPPPVDPGDPAFLDLGLCAQVRGSDPHECPRRQPGARLQKSEFLRTGGVVVDVCAGGPCFAPSN